MLYLLFIMLIGCKEVDIPEIPETEITEPTVESDTDILTEPVEVVYTIHGVYYRYLGSITEVYDISDKFYIYILSGIEKRLIFEASYEYTDTDIIIDNNLFDYLLYPDKIVICGYSYYRQ